MAQQQQRQLPNLRTFIVLAVAIALLIAAPFALPLLSSKVMYPVFHMGDIQSSAERHGVDPYLVCAIIKCESDWDDAALSDAGAVGLMQIMPETAQTMVTLGLVDGERFPLEELSSPAANIEYGCACLSYLAGEFDTTEQVIAAYNAGLGPVRIWIADAEANEAAFTDAIAYQETRAYVARVLVSYTGYQELYPSLYPDPE